ncbi:uncharacterized protein TRUGW13939_10493 [Talaromyces rugulosus]|uniref:DUF7703 domain-containing protein n=1 Tax=Talaromyces rugulosus TaxID=121627 RepID=A0A7H8RFK2_TALRU|nr:uncharacterized protein TRUGW13939_10493 [Talaromyces rugulosus]QKX63323.1 hypothetical protein TRUGW13939_10493 [Talaromyces rugulosus]
MLKVGQVNETDTALAYFITAVIAISLYNSIETVVIVLFVFKRYGGTYFWSLLAACLGLFMMTFGYSTYFYDIVPNLFGQSAPTIVGWCIFMVAQSVVLWSRLHLVLQNRKILRAVIVMICSTAIFLLIPTAVLAFGNDIRPPRQVFIRGYQIMENIQLTVFTLQEAIISALYIWGTISILRYATEKSKRNLILQLLAINVVLILMDVTILVIQYCGYRTLQINIKSLIYSLKLKLELAVLTRLVDYVKKDHSETSDFVNSVHSVHGALNVSHSKSATEEVEVPEEVVPRMVPE